MRRFRKMRALVLGDAMLDTYLEGTATRLCSEGPIPVVAKTAEYRIPGGAANTAANLKALGADVALLGVVGEDLAASLLRKALHEQGVSDQWLVEDAASPTLHKLRILADGQYVVRFDEGGTHEQTACYDEACQRLLLERLQELYAWCDLVVISDYRYGVVSDQVIERLRHLHEAEPKVLLLDSKALQRFRGLPATLATPNYAEACTFVDTLCGTSYSEQKNKVSNEVVEQLGRHMLDLLPIEFATITLGEQGVALFHRAEGYRRLPAHPVARANDVGAGDSFTAAMALAIAVGGSVEEAARIAIDAASIAISKQHTSTVRYQELLQRVSVRECAAVARPTSSSNEHEDLSTLLAQVHENRSTGQTVVFTNGIFDILHAGHIQFLRQAKALGDVLVVGINSDKSARRLKGQGRPINSAADRVALVMALDMVDHVVLFNEDTPAELIKLLRPHIHVKGGDYVDESLPEAAAVRAVGGHVVILPLAGSMSTSSLIDRISALTNDEAQSEQRPLLHMPDYRSYQVDGHRQQGGAL